MDKESSQPAQSFIQKHFLHVYYGTGSMPDTGRTVVEKTNVITYVTLLTVLTN